MIKCWLVIVLCVVANQLAAQIPEEYEQQLSVVRDMLADGQYRAAAAQAEGLATAAKEAQLPGVRAEALLMHGTALVRQPNTTAAVTVKGVRSLRQSAQLYRDLRDGVMVDSLMALLSVYQEGVDVSELDERVKERVTRNRNLVAADAIDENAMNAILSLQEKEIMALNDSQLRQMIILEQKDRLLDDYAFQALADSVQLINQEREIAVQAAQVKQEQQRRNFLTAIAVAVLLLLGLLYARFRSSRRHELELEEQNAVIAAERERSEELLLNILPAPIAEELKEKGKAAARRYESVTVMFVDFKGFSALAKTMPPERLIDLLDEAFQALDNIVTRHGIEKIKTIGDAYMCAGGVPVPTADHADVCVRAALDIQDYLAKHPHFKARIGIHTGPVVAGVVGLRKFVYDIWGDTVNQAARLETAGEPGRVAVSETTQSLLSNKFTSEAAGTFEAKNIGPMRRYFVELDRSAQPPDAHL